MDRPHEMVLRLSARQEDWLIARMALSGLGMLAGLDADLIGDLQTAVNECCDCLLHQTTTPETLVLSARAEKGRLQFRFSAEGEAGQGPADALDAGDRPLRAGNAAAGSPSGDRRARRVRHLRFSGRVGGGSDEKRATVTGTARICPDPGSGAA